ncbi:MAG TPA: PilZ domain-containing protein [Terriglobia bacterium]|nr:PilZ domain-containing protein [Terriglobia bacterium]
MRNGKRFEIESPITVGVRDLSNGHGLEFGRLREISARGARFSLDRPLRVNTETILLVHFSDPYERATTIRFEGTVTRVGSDPPYEIALRFRSGARIFAGGLADFLERQGKRLASGAGKGGLQSARGKRGPAEPAGIQGTPN